MGPSGGETLKKIQEELDQSSEKEKAEFFPGFFKAMPGGYGEGDRFLGVRVPHQRRIAKKYWKEIPEEDLEKLLDDPYHERRLTGHLMLIQKFEKAGVTKMPA